MTSTTITKSEKLFLARKNCANYFIDGCLGCMMSAHNGKLTFKINKALAGKPCIVGKKDCEYFETTVLPPLV